MANISVDAGLTPEDNALEATSRLFSYLWQQAWGEAAGVASGDADALHDMRVSLRRLRSALQNFEGDKDAPLIHKRVRREFVFWRKELGKLGDALGSVRDYDVLDDYLKEYAKKKLKIEVAESAGLAHFERYLQIERARHFAPMVKQVNKAAEPGRLREEFARYALGLPGIALHPPPLRDVAQIILPQRLDDVYEHAIVLEDDAAEEGHHEFRKSLRRLRYALETLSVCFDTPVKPHLKNLVKIQDILGEMQDRAVLRETVFRAFAGKNVENQKASAKRNRAKSSSPEEAALSVDPELPPDVATFIHFGERRHRQLLGHARTFWREHEHDGMFAELRALVL